MWSLGVVFILFIGVRNLLFCINYSCELDMLVIFTLFVSGGMGGKKPPVYFHLFICLSCGKWLGIVGHEKSSCCALHQMLLATEQWGYWGISITRVTALCRASLYQHWWSSMVLHGGTARALQVSQPRGKNGFPVGFSSSHSSLPDWVMASLCLVMAKFLCKTKIWHSSLLSKPWLLLPSNEW